MRSGVEVQSEGQSPGRVVAAGPAGQARLDGVRPALQRWDKVCVRLFIVIFDHHDQ